MKFHKVIISSIIIFLLIIPSFTLQAEKSIDRTMDNVYTSSNQLPSTQQPLRNYKNYLPIEPPEPLIVDTQKIYFTDNVIDPYLNQKLSETEYFEMIDIVVQFKGSIQASDLNYLRTLGFDIIREYTIVPGVNCIGPRQAIELLADYDRVFWIEYNEELKYNMHGTTKIINATDVWYSDILNINGLANYRIDGTGITVVVLDSGIDAGHPDLDYKTKTIMNLKSDNGNPPWIEMENSDTSSGHGTHCAGTVAGNGDASAGSRRGVAPGANLIGLSVGEAFFITGALGGLNWVYEQSRPGANPYNIRVVSNSWGAGGGEYNPQDSISQAAEKITYENNVNVVFAAGNSGGDGSDIQCSNYGNTPAIICVAALEHDGEGIAEFSSRGKADLNGTWPDISAPGVSIWSTAARRTLISTMTKTNAPVDFNPYYFAISGTSMATPHISGICALLWQAYPGLRISNVHDDYNGEEFPDWFNVSNTLMHESELILEASAHYIPSNGDNGVPENANATGWNGKPYDFAQGYGMAMVDRAVGIALTLKELRTRDFNLDGAIDYPDATVFDALKQYKNIMTEVELTKQTDSLETVWTGEWVKFNNQTTNFLPYYTDESHMLYIPPEAKKLKLTLSYSMIQTVRPQVGTLSLVIDVNGDGNPDWSQPLSPDENKVSEIDLESSTMADARDSTWIVNIRGHGIILPMVNFVRKNQYYEARIPYSASAVLIMDLNSKSNSSVDYRNLHAIYGQWEFSEPSPEYSNGTITMNRHTFDLTQVKPTEIAPEVKKREEFLLWPWLLLALVAALILYLLAQKKKKQKMIEVQPIEVTDNLNS